jgi:hypothetical protein
MSERPGNTPLPKPKTAFCQMKTSRLDFVSI